MIYFIFTVFHVCNTESFTRKFNLTLNVNANVNYHEYKQTADTFIMRYAFHAVTICPAVVSENYLNLQIV